MISPARVRPSSSVRPAILTVLTCLIAIPTLRAADFDWGSAGTGGIYSTPTNWSPTAPAGGPGSVDAAILIDASADRTITVDAAAAGTLGTLTFNQASPFANTLELTKAFAVTNAVTLGATAGTEVLRFAPAASSFTTTLTGGLNLNAGGVVSFGFGGAGNAFTPALAGGPVTVGDGTILVREGVTGTSALANINSSAFSMTAGAITIAAPVAAHDTRLRFAGNFSATGGAITKTGVGGGSLFFGGATSTLSGTATLGAGVALTLDAGSQSLSSTTAYNDLTLRGGGASLVKTVSSTAAGQNLGALVFINSNNNGTTTLKLASNLTLKTGSALPGAANFGGQGGSSAGTVNFGIDTNGNTLDLSANTGTFTPSRASNGTAINTNYLFTSSTGSGAIRAASFSLGTATQVNIGPGVALEATATGVTSTLSGGGTIDPAAIFRFLGTANASIHTLNSARTLGSIEVRNGTLALGSGATIAAASTVSVGYSASTEQNSVFRFTGGGAYGNAFDLSKAPQISASTATAQPRNRLELTNASQALEIAGTVLVGQTGTVAGLPAAGTNTQNRRAEFNVVDASSVMNITGQISQNTGGTAGAFGGININGSNGGVGTVRFGNASNNFTAGITVTNGTLVLGGNAPTGAAGVLGAGTAGVALGDGGTPATATVAVLTDGPFSVGKSFALNNGASGAAIASYVLGGTAAGSSLFSGDITTASSGGDKTLTLTQAGNGSSTFSGSIGANAGAGSTSVTKTGLGTVVLSRAAGNAYDGSTLISAGTLLVANTSNSATGAGLVNVGAAGTLAGMGGSISGAVTVAGTLAPGDQRLAAGSRAGTIATGALTLEGSSTFSLTLDSATAFSAVTAPDISIASGAKLSLALGYTPAENTSFLVGVNTGVVPVSGFFTADGTSILDANGGFLAEGDLFTFGAQAFTISYVGGNGNDIALVAVPEPGSIVTLLGGLALLGGLQRLRRSRIE